MLSGMPSRYALWGLCSPNPEQSALKPANAFSFARCVWQVRVLKPMLPSGARADIERD